MPKVFSDYSDDRNKAWCIHCGSRLSEVKPTRDHTPSKVLLDRPFPKNLAVTPICGPCNQGFSLDEEYFVAFLSSVLTGTCHPDKQVIPHVSKTFGRSPSLRALIESQREEQFCLFGRSDVRWYPDFRRFSRVILKNARAHMFFENGEPMLHEPEVVEFQPISAMSTTERHDFFGMDLLQPWCEVGTRWNFRLIEDDSFDRDGFLVVQPDIYRFRIEGGGAGVRTVIREYLATTVIW